MRPPRSRNRGGLIKEPEVQNTTITERLAHVEALLQVSNASRCRTSATPWPIPPDPTSASSSTRHAHQAPSALFNDRPSLVTEVVPEPACLAPPLDTGLTNCDEFQSPRTIIQPEMSVAASAQGEMANSPDEIREGSSVSSSVTVRQEIP